jgi:hypothetical protein
MLRPSLSLRASDFALVFYNGPESAKASSDKSYGKPDFAETARGEVCPSKLGVSRAKEGRILFISLPGVY